MSPEPVVFLRAVACSARVWVQCRHVPCCAHVQPCSRLLFQRQTDHVLGKAGVAGSSRQHCDSLAGLCMDCTVIWQPLLQAIMPTNSATAPLSPGARTHLDTGCRMILTTTSHVGLGSVQAVNMEHCAAFTTGLFSTALVKHSLSMATSSSTLKLRASLPIFRSFALQLSTTNITVLPS